MQEPEFPKNRNEILLVDDDSTVLARHKDVFKLLNPIAISTFLSASLPLEYISLPQKKNNKFLIFLSMPASDAWSMLECLKIHPLAYSVRVIMMSSSHTPFNVERKADFPMVTDFIDKPINEDQLLSVFLKRPSLRIFLAEPFTLLCPKLVIKRPKH